MDVCPSEGDVTFESLVKLKCNVMVSILGRRQAILDVGMFDEGLRSCEDFDLWLRMVHAGKRFIYHRKVLVRYRRHPNSLSADALWLYTNGLKVLNKLKETLSLALDDASAVNEQIAQYQGMKNLLEGKRALEEGKTVEAIGKFELANSISPTRKLAWTLRFLRYAPRTFRQLYSLRQRHEFGKQH